MGKTFTDMRKELFEQGFDPNTHYMLAFGSGGDVSVMLKIIDGNNEPFSHPPKRSEDDYLKTYQPVHVLQLCRLMFTSDVKGGFTLSNVYTTLFGAPDVQAHDPGGDTMMLADILRVLANVNDV